MKTTILSNRAVISNEPGAANYHSKSAFDFAPRPQSQVAARFFVLALCCLSLGQARAQHHVEYGLNLSLGATYYELYNQGEQPVGPVVHQEIVPGYGQIAGNANVGFGVNKARVELSGTNSSDPLSFDYGFASSRYWDSFQFSDPVLDGTHGFFDATLFVSGSGSAALGGEFLSSPDTEFDAFWHAVINVSVTGVTAADGSSIQSGIYAGEWLKGFSETTLNYFGDPLNTYQQVVTFEFIYGQPILMDTFLQVDVQFDNQTSMVPGTLDAVIDLGNSTYWGGIQRLRDARGNPVTNALYSSSSGVDYRASTIVRPTLQASKIGNQMQLTWTGNFKLESAATPQGSYTALANASSPYLVPPGEAHRFYRLVLGQ
ncbi:MAG TPA: hypothetical protein VJA21_29265 [Verrucomicrobiae bacterium]